MIKTDEPGLRKAFESYGTIVDVNVKSKDNGITFAFIEFDSVDSAEKAVDAYSNFYVDEIYNFAILFLHHDLIYLAWTKNSS